MGSMSVMHWAIVAIVVFLFFGRGKITALMGDLGGALKEGKNVITELDGSKDEIKSAAKNLARLTHETKKEFEL